MSYFLVLEDLREKNESKYIRVLVILKQKNYLFPYEQITSTVTVILEKDKNFTWKSVMINSRFFFLIEGQGPTKILLFMSSHTYKTGNIRLSDLTSWFCLASHRGNPWNKLARFYSLSGIWKWNQESRVRICGTAPTACHLGHYGEAMFFHENWGAEKVNH